MNILKIWLAASRGSCRESPRPAANNLPVTQPTERSGGIARAPARRARCCRSRVSDSPAHPSHVAALQCQIEERSKQRGNYVGPHRIKAGLAYVGREILQHSLTKRGFKGRVVSHRSPRKEARSSDSVGKSPNCRLRLRFWPSVIATLAQPFKNEGM